MLVVTAVGVFAFILIMALAIDFGNWNVHKRQLQNRVDASAFAAGVEYGAWFGRCLAVPPTAANQAITNAAMEYVGIGSPYNASATDPDVTVSVPCTPHDGEYWTEVTATEDGVGSFFAGFGVPVLPESTAVARVAVRQAATASGMRPFVLADAAAVSCVSATYQQTSGSNPTTNTVGLARVGGSTTQWSATPSFAMPAGNASVSVSVKVGCGSNAPTYPGSAYVTRVPSVGLPQLTNLQLQPTVAASCTNGNPYFIPRNGAPCQMTVTATVSFANPNNQSVRAQVGSGGTFNLTKGSGNDWSGTFTVNPRSGTGPNGTQSVAISARNSGGGPFTSLGEARIQAGTAVNQGQIANVVLQSYARSPSQPFGPITVTLRGLNPNEIETINDGADCGPGNLHTEFVDGCTGPFKIKTGTGACATAVPFDCVGAIGVGQLNSIENDYDDRWAPGGTCTPNNWPNITAGDPRLVSTFLINEVSVNPSGNYPITGFAGFYVTGWSGDPSSCNSQNDPEPDDAVNGAVWGHYVKLVLPSADGTPGTTACNPNDSAACIAVLVR